ncbi:MAG: NADP-dependent oxidoreductase [Gammaproteobacteria bacterium]
MGDINKQAVLASPLDESMPRPDNFQVVESGVPDPGDGEFLVRHIYVSLDPFQRMALSGRYGFAPGTLGDSGVPRAETVGQVMASRHPDFKEGDYVAHFGGWQNYSLSDGSEARKVDPQRAPLSTYLGVLGMPGLTAYASVVKLADIQPGQTALVSAAAGPVGSTLGQIAIQLGGRAIGIAGSDEKCAHVTDEFGFAHCINYKNDNYVDQLKEACGDGVDIYHDNVGGQMLINAFSVLKEYGTVVLCGLISGYNDPSQHKGLPLGLPLIKRAVIKGLIVYDFKDKYDEYLDLAAPWVADGKMKYKEDRAEGVENAGAQFCKLMKGENFGKTLVVVGPE